jgi:transcriptional regulator with XRE-family HTH domain
MTSEISKSVRSHRGERSLRDLAGALGLAHQTISNWESGAIPSLEYLAKIKFDGIAENDKIFMVDLINLVANYEIEKLNNLARSIIAELEQ